MASLSREFANALQGVFGPAYATPIYPNSTIASASGEGTLHDSGRGIIYGVSWSVTASCRATDASSNSLTPSSGVGSTASPGLMGAALS